MSNTEMELQKLKDYQVRVDEWLKQKGSGKWARYNSEQNTTIKFVVPLFELLGWKSLNKDMEFEYHIEGRGHSDIALYTHISSSPKILIEIKPIQDHLEKAKMQIFSYLKNSGVNYGVTTNGRELTLHSKRYVRRDARRPRPLFRLRSEDYVEYRNVLWFLSKEMVEKGALDELANAYHSKKYWTWWNSLKTGNSLHDKYKLPLKYAILVFDEKFNVLRG